MGNILTNLEKQNLEWWLPRAGIWSKSTNSIISNFWGSNTQYGDYC